TAGTDLTSTLNRARTANDQSATQGFFGRPNGDFQNEWVGTGYPDAIALSDLLRTIPGNNTGGTNQYLAGRVTGDTDSTSTTFAQYQANIVNGQRVGNGLRVVGVPIVAGPPTDVEPHRSVIGVAAFFLNNLNYNGISGGVSSCAEYIGSFTIGANAKPGNGGA